MLCHHAQHVCLPACRHNAHSEFESHFVKIKYLNIKRPEHTESQLSGASDARMMQVMNGTTYLSSAAEERKKTRRDAPTDQINLLFPLVFAGMIKIFVD